MEFSGYCHKHLDLMIRGFTNVSLALRKKMNSNAYTDCESIYKDLEWLDKVFWEDDEIGVSETDMLYMYSRVYIWIQFYLYKIDDIPVRNSTLLLYKQISKKLKRVIESYKSRGYSLM